MEFVLDLDSSSALRVNRNFVIIAWLGSQLSRGTPSHVLARVQSWE